MTTPTPPSSDPTPEMKCDCPNNGHGHASWCAKISGARPSPSSSPTPTLADFAKDLAEQPMPAVIVTHEESLEGLLFESSSPTETPKAFQECKTCEHPGDCYFAGECASPSSTPTPDPLAEIRELMGDVELPSGCAVFCDDGEHCTVIRSLALSLEQATSRLAKEREERSLEYVSWAQRYDDAVQPLQRRCSELLAQTEVAEQQRDQALKILDECEELTGFTASAIPDEIASLMARERLSEELQRKLEAALSRIAQLTHTDSTTSPDA